MWRWGRQPYGLGWPGSAWSPAMSMTARRLPEVGAWPSKLAQAVLGQRRVDLDLVVVVGGGWAVASSTAWPTRIGRVHARIVRWWEPVRSEVCLLRQADRHAAGESLGRSCRVEPNIKKPIGHIPLANQN